uniref:Uncharacterized protein n=1 Tax=viral metagenome TaxID=1070528 RepID=A0A6M3K1X7_9ZZZZ
MATIGNTDASGTGNSTIANYVNAIHTIVPPSSGVLNSITAHLNFYWAARSVLDIKAKAALYSRSGTTFTLMAATTERVFDNFTYAGAGYQWYTFTFASPPTVIGSTEYALAVWANDPTPVANYDVLLKYAATSAFGITIVSATYNGFPTPYTQTPAGLDPSIYGTYTPSAAGPPKGSLALLGVGT